MKLCVGNRPVQPIFAPAYHNKFNLIFFLCAQSGASARKPTHAYYLILETVFRTTVSSDLRVWWPVKGRNFGHIEMQKKLISRITV